MKELDDRHRKIQVLYVPGGTAISSTHAGNLYDAHGNSPYWGIS